jgi:ethanolamine utilization protein EutN
MILGQVIGTVVARHAYEGLEGKKLLVVQPLDHHGKESGGAVVAVDTAQAGPKDLVVMAQSREAALACEPWFVPVDHAVIAIVDSVDAAKQLLPTVSP